MTAKNNTTPWVRLGDYIEECDERNTTLAVTLSQGISNTKVFQEPKQVSANSKSDKIVRKGFFAYNRATTRNGDKISIAYRMGEDCTVSSAYCVFKIIAEDILNPNFLWLWFSRPEFDRYARYMSQGSAHEFFDWEELCRVQIPLPSLEVQQELVDTYTGLQRLAEDNEALIAPLSKACQAFIVDCQKKYPTVELGKYIEECREKNTNGLITKVLGLSTQKDFREPSSRVNLSELTKYKIVLNNEFAYVPTTDTWKVFACALNKGESIVVSPIYIVFKVICAKKLHSEFLCLILKNTEFDRYARFNSWGSARENFSWEELCRVQIPLPPLEVQESIVNLYHCIEEARKIAREARAQLQNLCPALIQYAEHN